jgi:hypothetical protein
MTRKGDVLMFWNIFAARALPRGGRQRYTFPALIVLALAGLLLATPAVRADDVPDVDVDVVDSTVSPGETLRYKITVENWTDYELVRVDVKIPYNTDLLTPSGSDLNDEDDWVSKASEGDLVMTFGRIEDDDSRSATIELEVNPNAPDNTEIDHKADYVWYSETDSGSGRTEDFEAVILNPAAQPGANIAPDAGPAGTVFQVEATRFAADEPVITWLNLPDGSTQALELHGTTDDQGTIRLQFDSSGLVPGSYSIVLYGKESERERVAGFRILP